MEADTSSLFCPVRFLQAGGLLQETGTASGRGICCDPANQPLPLGRLALGVMTSELLLAQFPAVLSLSYGFFVFSHIPHTPLSLVPL